VVKGGKKNYKSFYLLLALIAVAGIGALTYISTNRGSAFDEMDSTLPKVESEGYVIGDSSAPIEVVEFGDFECPTCARFAELIEPDVRAQLVATGKIRFRYIDFPLGAGAMHYNSWPAARAAACADEQGKFWEMHDLIYRNQDRWSSRATRSPEGLFKEMARQIPGLDARNFDGCVNDKRTQARVQAHYDLATKRGVRSTPTFTAGTLTGGYMNLVEFRQFVDSAIKTQAKAAPDSGKQ
jgi:protein-disulfide isomerase